MERTLNVVRTVRLHSTVVLSAGEKTEIFIVSRVLLWPRGRPLRKVNLSTTRTCTYPCIDTVEF